jgi:hypothetical protein
VATLTNEQLLESVQAFSQHKTVRLAAAALGLPESTMRDRLRKANSLGLEVAGERWQPQPDWQEAAPAFEYPPIPDAEPSYDELKARQISDYRRLHAHKEASKIITVKVKIEGPYGVCVLGDPHIDHHGTDWPLLDEHTQLIKNTPGLFGTCVGDITNNWIGRLARLYGEQNMSRKRALILAEGWLREVRWLYIDPGNHDLWSGADDPVRWMTRFAGTHYKWEGSRISLESPGGVAPVIFNSRHDHPGYSMYHPTHGPLKASIFDGFHDDVYTCGHIHSGAYMVRPHNNGKLSHLLRLSAYKIYDSHKDARGFLDAALPAVTIIVSPQAMTQVARVKVFLDPAEGADYLTFLRRRHGQGKTAA